MADAAPRRIVVIAGPNGAGKTTFANEFLAREAGVRAFLNADLIAWGLSPLDPVSPAGEAGRLMLREIQVRAGRGESFAIETTLSGRAPLRWIRDWRQRGYRITLFYLRLASPELAIARVRARVEQGGHDVPESVVRRRFAKSLSNFAKLYRPLVDRWAVYDNSGTRPLLIEEGGG
jgi:predicted ABC-type ATPase